MENKNNEDMYKGGDAEERSSLKVKEVFGKMRHQFFEGLRFGREENKMETEHKTKLAERMENEELIVDKKEYLEEKYWKLYHEIEEKIKELHKIKEKLKNENESLSEKRKPVMEEEMEYYYPEKDVKEAVRIFKEKSKLKFPLGCNIKLRDETTTCGDISFGNKIILCDNCTQKLINKFEENENEFDKIFGERLICLKKQLKNGKRK